MKNIVLAVALSIAALIGVVSVINVAMMPRPLTVEQQRIELARLEAENRPYLEQWLNRKKASARCDYPNLPYAVADKLAATASDAHPMAVRYDYGPVRRYQIVFLSGNDVPDYTRIKFNDGDRQTYAIPSDALEWATARLKTDTECDERQLVCIEQPSKCADHPRAQVQPTATYAPTQMRQVQPTHCLLGNRC